LATLIVGLLGTGAALLMIRAGSILDVWWQISGIFGGALLGLFVLAFLGVRLRLWQGLVSIAASIAVITWGTFARNLPKLEIGNWKLEIPVWAQCNLDGIIVGAVGTAAFLAVSCLFALTNRRSSFVPRLS